LQVEERTRACLWLHSTQVSTWSSTLPFHLAWIWLRFWRPRLKYYHFSWS